MKSIRSPILSFMLFNIYVNLLDEVLRYVDCSVISAPMILMHLNLLSDTKKIPSISTW